MALWNFDEVATPTASEQNNQASEPKGQAEQEETKEQTLTVYQEYQQNKLIARALSAEILKGLRAGEPIEPLFLKALKIVSMLTGNRLFYDQAAGDLSEHYGITE